MYKHVFFCVFFFPSWNWRYFIIGASTEFFLTHDYHVWKALNLWSVMGLKNDECEILTCLLINVWKVNEWDCHVPHKSWSIFVLSLIQIENQYNRTLAFAFGNFYFYQKNKNYGLHLLEYRRIEADKVEQGCSTQLGARQHFNKCYIISEHLKYSCWTTKCTRHRVKLTIFPLKALLKALHLAPQALTVGLMHLLVTKK